MSPGARILFPVRGLAISFTCLAFAYAINNCFDREVDRAGERSKNPLAGVLSLPASILAAAYAPAAVAVIVTVVLLPRAFPVVLASLLTSTLYSAPPFRCKRLFLVGFVLNALIFAPLFVIGWIDSGGAPMGAVPHAVFFSLLVLHMQAVHELEDVEEDRRMRIRTLANVLGGRSAQVLSPVLLAAFAAYGWILSRRGMLSPEMLLISVLYAGAAIGFSWRRHRKQVLDAAAFRLAQRWLGIAYGAAVLAVRLFEIV